MTATINLQSHSIESIDLQRAFRTNGIIRHRPRKRHSAWEEADRASGGAYGRLLSDLAQRFPSLSPMELRVCVLVKSMLPSWRIGEMLRISEKAVENYRVKIRRKIGCCGERLTSMLTKI